MKAPLMKSMSCGEMEGVPTLRGTMACRCMAGSSSVVKAARVMLSSVADSEVTVTVIRAGCMLCGQADSTCHDVWT